MKKWFAYLLCLVAVSCSDNFEKQENEDVAGSAVHLEMMTKGNGDKRSYIFYLIGKQNSAVQGVETFGTYLDAESGDPLIPVAVGNDGSPVSGEYDSSKGLRAFNGTYSLFTASPAVQMSEIPETDGKKGYHYTRNEEGVYVSDPVSVTVGGVYLSDEDGSDYVYDVSGQTLRQPRSRLKLKFACGTDIGQTTLRSINLKNFISEGYYIPVEMRFHYLPEYILEEQALYPTEGKGALTVDKGTVVDLNVDEYILSMNYKAVDEVGNAKFPLPSLEIEVGGDDSSDQVTFNAPLSWDFKPQHTYEFTIVINSVYVNMTLIVSPWDVNGEGNSYVGEPETWEIRFPLKDGVIDVLGWEMVDKQTGTIG